MSSINDWPTSLIVYQIYPRSFMDSNNDGIGDLLGIRQKLSYLQKLGVNTIWLSPVYSSPMVDFGYDISDYKNIDPIFGTLSDFDELLNECHKKGVHLLMDFVPNHTSSKHPWFLNSQSSKKSSKRDWYIWKDPKPDGSEPNNWLSVFGGSAWEYEKKTKQYYLHSFDKEQPDLNWRNPKVVKEMLSVLRFWLTRGVDGFRVDVPEWMFKNEKFLDEPLNPLFVSGSQDPHSKLIHKYTHGLAESTEMIKRFVSVLEEYDRKFMVTEVWSPLGKLLKMYNVVERKFFTPFNFSLLTLPWNADSHRKFIDKFDQGVGQSYLPNYVLGSHDKSRLASRIGRKQARIASMLHLTLRGIPFIYYGEEIGMEDTHIPSSEIQDPFEKKTPRLGLGRDPERTPMQWSKSKQAGFTKGKPWLLVNDNYLEINVESEEKNPKSIFNLYKRLIHLRKHSKALVYGSYASLNSGSSFVFVFTRHFEDETILIILNYSDHKQKISLPFSEGKIILNTFLDKKEEIINIENLVLRPNEGYIIHL